MIALDLDRHMRGTRTWRACGGLLIVHITMGALFFFLALLIGGAANGQWGLALVGAVGTVALGWLNWKWANSGDRRSDQGRSPSSED